MLSEIQRKKIENIRKSIDVLQVNEMLFGNKKTHTESQQMRAYQPDDRIYILQYQQQNKLNNIQTATHFKMSRNTLAKWKKEIRAKR